ncbi:MAG: SWIM zinc finger family protein [Ignavibacteriales bacterium]
MLSNQSVTNEKPRNLGGTKSQGGFKANSNSNSTTFNDSKSRYEKGRGLYKSSRVSIGSNGLFKVSGYYEVDTERMTCTCPDYKTRKEACKHLFAAMLFVKNRGKQRIEDLEGFNGNGNGSHKDIRI